MKPAETAQDPATGGSSDTVGAAVDAAGPEVGGTTPTEDAAVRPSTGAPGAFSALDRALLMDQIGMLVLVRHGQQVWPSERGAPMSQYTDPPLSELGIRQADVLAEYLSQESIAAVYSSNLARAKDTGTAVASRHGIVCQVLEELREVEIFRDLPPDAKPSDVVRPEILAGATERFVLERRWDVFPLTETGAELRQRVTCAIEGILVAHPGRRVVVACHGGVINSYLCHLLGLEEDMFFPTGHASINRVRIGAERRVVHSLNEVHHLQAVDPALVTF